jgi:hypothetical protein
MAVKLNDFSWYTCEVFLAFNRGKEIDPSHLFPKSPLAEVQSNGVDTPAHVLTGFSRSHQLMLVRL